MPKLLRAKWLLMPIALILIGAGYAGWRYLSQWESTDDAQIEGHIHPVNAKVGGTVASVNVRDNQPVQAGTVLVQLDARDYEIDRMNIDRKSTRLNSSHRCISYAVFCLKKKR